MNELNELLKKVIEDVFEDAQISDDTEILVEAWSFLGKKISADGFPCLNLSSFLERIWSKYDNVCGDDVLQRLVNDKIIGVRKNQITIIEPDLYSAMTINSNGTNRILNHYFKKSWFDSGMLRIKSKGGKEYPVVNEKLLKTGNCSLIHHFDRSNYFANIDGMYFPIFPNPLKKELLEIFDWEEEA